MNILVLKAAASTGLISFALLMLWMPIQHWVLLAYSGLVLIAAIGVAVIGLFIEGDRIKY